MIDKLYLLTKNKNSCFVVVSGERPWVFSPQFFRVLSSALCFIVDVIMLMFSLLCCSFTVSATDLIRRSFYPQVVFVLRSFSTFSACTIKSCFYQGFSESWQFNLSNSRASWCCSKHSPGLTVQLFV